MSTVRNKVGFNLLLWSAVVSEKMNPIADKLRDIGYDGVEVCLAAPSSKSYLAFGKHIQELELEVTSVMVLGKDEDPIHASAAVREKALDKLKWAVDVSNEMGSYLICGPVHSAFANFSNHAPTADEYKRSAEILHKAGEYAQRSNTVFAVEALNRFECYLCNTVQQLSRLIGLADHPNVRLMFDTFHANMEEKNIGAAILNLSGQLAHVHVSENDRGTPGEGHIPWEEVFTTLSQINYKGWLTIESFSRQDELFANSINVWRQYSDPWTVAEKGLEMIQTLQANYPSTN